MIEVEVKIPVEDHERIRDKLLEMGFVLGKYLEEKDTYFNSEFHDFLKTGEALRIRRVTDLESSEDKSLVTYKGPRLDSVTKTRKEIEIEVGSGDDLEKILLSLGFRPVAPVVKRRRYMHFENLTACLDSVNGLGNFMELEIIVPADEDRAAAVEKISSYLEMLGYSMKDTIKISYLGLLQNKMNKTTEND